MIPSNKVSFEDLLDRFPPIDLPITLSEDIHLEFSKVNPPLPSPVVEKYLSLEQIPEQKEFTEYIPCFSLKNTENFHAIVYWIGSLLDYQYVLMTFDQQGNKIDHSVIAGTKVIDNALLRSVATIDDAWIIYVVAGVANAHTNDFDPSSTKSFTFELLANGEIISNK